MVMRAALMILGTAALIGCGSKTPPPTSPAGNYEGTVTFQASAGTRDYTGWLQIDESGDYFFTVKEMALLSEMGKWTEDGGVLTLTPDLPLKKEDDEGETSILDVMGAMQSAKPPHTMRIDDDWMTVRMNDGPFSGVMKRFEPEEK
jgi:hypothetical protein